MCELQFVRTLVRVIHSTPTDSEVNIMARRISQSSAMTRRYIDDLSSINNPDLQHLLSVTWSCKTRRLQHNSLQLCKTLNKFSVDQQTKAAICIHNTSTIKSYLSCLPNQALDLRPLILKVQVVG